MSAAVLLLLCLRMSCRVVRELHATAPPVRQVAWVTPSAVRFFLRSLVPRRRHVWRFELPSSAVMMCGISTGSSHQLSIRVAALGPWDLLEQSGA